MSITLEDLDTDTGTALLNELHQALTRYVILPAPEAADAVTLYIAATHAQQVWEHASRLVIKSPLKRCGKTRLQEVCRETVHNPLPTTNISPAALARSIDDDDPPTLILDEADTVFGKREQRSEGAEDIRGILNSGHSRGWPYVRWDAAARRRELCATFAMAIIGGIGDMPDTIEDRAVVISMRRRAPGEQVRQWRSRRAIPALRDLRDRLHEWVLSVAGELEQAEPELPAEDRAADVWEPLVAIADAAGGDWPDRARHACKVLAGDAGDPQDGTAGERLLADLREVFGAAHFLYSASILDRLSKIEEAPWATWHRGEPMSPRALSGLLKPYGVKTRDGREGGTGDQRKGLYRADLADAWRRYTEQAPRRDSRDTATEGDQQPDHAAETPVADDVADDFAASATGQNGRSDTENQPNVAPVAPVAPVAAGRLERATGPAPESEHCADCHHLRTRYRNPNRWCLAHMPDRMAP